MESDDIMIHAHTHRLSTIALLFDPPGLVFNILLPPPPTPHPTGTPPPSQHDIDHTASHSGSTVGSHGDSVTLLPQPLYYSDPPTVTLPYPTLL